MFTKISLLAKCDILRRTCHNRHTNEQKRARATKLTFDRVTAILRRLERGEDQNVVAASFGVSRKTIWRLLADLEDAVGCCLIYPSSSYEEIL